MSDILKARLVDALRFVADGADKFRLYMGHRVWVQAQQQEASKLLLTLQKECKTTGKTLTGIVNIDFKMKFDKLHFHETTQLHFGKRGISRHGGSIVWYEWDEENYYDVRKAVNQILSETNKQSGAIVLGLLDVAHKFVASQIPHIKNLVVFSDNASNYHAKEMVLWIPVLNRASSGPYISCFIHHETQDGKGWNDAHLSRAAQLVFRFIKLVQANGNYEVSVSMSKQLATALLDLSGLPYCGVQLVEFDWEQLGVLSETTSPITKEANKYFSRVSNVTFFPKEEKDSEWAKLDLSDSENLKLISFRIKAQNYSGIRDGCTFVADLSTGKFGAEDQGVDVGVADIGDNNFAKEFDADEDEDCDMEMFDSLTKRDVIWNDIWTL